jgi:hypothetical protein
MHVSGWQLINWLIFPAVALVLVPLLWRSARTAEPPVERADA